MTDQQFIYVMKGLRKIVPPKREILKDIWLSFFHGAKIGVVGANGSGKRRLGSSQGRLRSSKPPPAVELRPAAGFVVRLSSQTSLTVSPSPWRS